MSQIDRLADLLHGPDPTSGGPNEVCGCYQQARDLHAKGVFVLYPDMLARVLVDVQGGRYESWLRRSFAILDALDAKAIFSEPDGGPVRRGKHIHWAVWNHDEGRWDEGPGPQIASRPTKGLKDVSVGSLADILLALYYGGYISSVQEARKDAAVMLDLLAESAPDAEELHPNAEWNKVHD